MDAYIIKRPIGFLQKEPSPLQEDNLSCMKFIKNERANELIKTLGVKNGYQIKYTES